MCPYKTTHTPTNRQRRPFSFEVETKFGAFYTGGTVAWSADGATLLCQDQHRINVVSVDGNAVQRTIADTAGASTPLDAAAAAADDGLDVDAMYTFALSADDATVCSSHKSGLLKLWQLSDGSLIKQWKAIHQGPVPRLAFSPDSRLLASGGTDAAVRLWNAEQRVCLGALRGCQGVISVLAFGPQQQQQQPADESGTVVVAAGDDHRIHVWCADTLALRHVLAAHFSRVTAVSFAADNGHLVSAGRDKVLVLWSLATGRMVRTVPAYESLEGCVVLDGDAALPEGVAVAADSVYAATAGSAGSVKIWNCTTGRCVYTQSNSLIAPAAEDEGVACAQLLHNRTAQQFALISADHNIMVHNVGSFHCAKQLIGFSDEILDCVFVGKRGRYVAVATNSSAIKLYDTAASMNCRVLLGHTDIVLALAAHRNYLLSSAKDCTVRLWLVDPGTFTVCHLATATKHTAAVGSVAFGRLSHRVCASVSQDTCLKVWQLPEKFDEGAAEPLAMQCVATAIAHDKDVNCVTLSPNDQMIATGSQVSFASQFVRTGLYDLIVFARRTKPPSCGAPPRWRWSACSAATGAASGACASRPSTRSC